MEQKINNTHASDKTYITIPNLLKNKANHPIIEACINGVIEQDKRFDFGELTSLKTLLKNGWPNVELKKYIIPYIFSIEKQYHKKIPYRSEVLSFLIQKGADIEFSVISQDFGIEFAMAVISAGRNINFSYLGYTPLHAIVTNGEHFKWKEEIDYILQQGIDFNQMMQSPACGTALHLVMANEIFDDKTSHAKAKYLARALTNYPYNWNLQDGEGKTVLILAAKMRATKLLLDIIKFKKEKKLHIDFNIKDHHGRTALHYCCALGNVKGVEALINAGAEMEITDPLGKTPKDYAYLNVDEVKSILNSIHIDPERDENALNNYIVGLDYKPIRVLNVEIKAVKEDWGKVKNCVEFFFKSRPYTDEKLRKYDLDIIKIQTRNFSGKSLIEACIVGQKDVLNYMFQLEEKENKNFIGNFKPVISMKPKKKNYEQLVFNIQKHIETHPKHEIFLKSIQSKNYSKALRQACSAGEKYLVEILLTYLEKESPQLLETCLNETSENGKTPLHWAAMNAAKTNNVSTVALLLKYNPDVSLIDKDNKLYTDYLSQDNKTALGMAKSFLPR